MALAWIKYFWCTIKQNKLKKKIDSDDHNKFSISKASWSFDVKYMFTVQYSLINSVVLDNLIHLEKLIKQLLINKTNTYVNLLTIW